MELRKDYILDRYVIIAPRRGARPNLVPKDEKSKTSHDPKCPFCQGNEHMLPGIIDELSRDGKQIIKIVPNKFNAVEMEGNPVLQTHNKFYTFASAYGKHEVIIETPDHGLELEELPEDHIFQVLKTYIYRIQALNDLPNIKFVSVFKNRGRVAGASIAHSHSQVIAYNIKPEWISEEIMAIYKHVVNNEMCPICDVIEREKHSDRRVDENDHFAAFCPYASRNAYTVRIYPKRHLPNLVHLNDDELRALATMLKKILLRLDDLGYPPYNLLFHNAEPQGENFHFHIDILPRMQTWAGFELETGTIINTIAPEDAAKFYRSEE